MMTFLRSRRTVQLWAMVLGFYTGSVGAVFLIDPSGAQARTFLWAGASTLGAAWPYVLAGAYITAGLWLLLTGALVQPWRLRYPAMLVLSLWAYAVTLYLLSWPESWWTMLLVPIPALLSSFSIRVRAVVGPPQCAHRGEERHMRLVPPRDAQAG